MNTYRIDNVLASYLLEGNSLIESKVKCMHYCAFYMGYDIGKVHAYLNHPSPKPKSKKREG